MHFYVIILYVYEYEYVNLKKQYVVQQQFVSMVVQNCCDKDGRLNNLLGIYLYPFFCFSLFSSSLSLFDFSFFASLFLWFCRYSWFLFFLPLSISYLVFFSLSFWIYIYIYTCIVCILSNIYLYISIYIYLLKPGMNGRCCNFSEDGTRKVWHVQLICWYDEFHKGHLYLCITYITLFLFHCFSPYFLSFYVFSVSLILCFCR